MPIERRIQVTTGTTPCLRFVDSKSTRTLVPSTSIVRVVGPSAANAAKLQRSKARHAAARTRHYACGAPRQCHPVDRSAVRGTPSCVHLITNPFEEIDMSKHTGSAGLHASESLFYDGAEAGGTSVLAHVYLLEWVGDQMDT